MSKVILLLIFFSTFTFIEQSKAASFDCVKASTKVEKIICTDEELSRLDSGIRTSFLTAIERTNDEAAVRRDQRMWLKERNRCTDRGCLMNAYLLRLWQLTSPDPAHPVGVTARPHQISHPQEQADPPVVTKTPRSPQPKKVAEPPWPEDRADPERYAKESRVLELLKAQFLFHLDQATNISIPYVPEEFPWRIDWNKQQAYCNDIWSAFTAEREKRLRFFEHPTASVYRDGVLAWRKAWRNAKFERGCPNEFPFYHASHVDHSNIVGQQLIDHSPDWIVELRPWLDSLEDRHGFLRAGRLIYAHEPDADGNRCATTELGGGGGAGSLTGSYKDGGMENIYVLVDDQPLILKFGIYVSAYDHSSIEDGTFDGVLAERDAGYYDWFGKRRGRVGQGYVALQSHQTNLYRSLALEPSGYKESSYLVSDSNRLDKRVGGPDGEFVDFHRFTCVFNFDLNETR